METLSLCMIVKNEVGYIEDCLKEIKEAFYDVVIVDTGSNDGTQEVVKKMVGKCYEFTFKNNFAEARNYANSLVKGDWVLSLDADERIDVKMIEKIKRFLENCNSEVGGIKLDKYNFFKNGGWYIASGLKIYRNDARFIYEGEVGESNSGSIKRNGYKIISKPDFFINHIGHAKTAKSRHMKNNYYLSIFRNRQLKDPDNLFLSAYVAVLLRAEGQVDEAIQMINEAAKKPGSENDFIFQLFSGHVHKANGDYLSSEKNYKQALSAIPNEPNAISNLAIVYAATNRIPEAIELLKDGIEHNNEAWFLYMNLGLIYEKTQEFAKAISMYQTAYEGNSFFDYYHDNALDEMDPYRIFYYETFPNYAGFKYHMSYCKYRLGLDNE